MMRWVALLLCLLPRMAGAAEPRRVPFTLPGLSAARVCLVLSQTMVVDDHSANDAGDSVRARVDEDAPDADYAHTLLVEVSDPKGNVLWRHDFGFNWSAPQGNTVTACYQPQSHLLLIHYDGYKWDHAHRLLFVKVHAGTPSVREYDSAKRDLLPTLQRRRDFPDGYDYWISPTGFVGRDVQFEGIPLQKPERQSVHPFAQEEPFYQITATVGGRGRMIPTDVKTNR